MSTQPQKISKAAESLYKKLRLEVNRSLNQFSVEASKISYEKISQRLLICQYFSYIEQKKKLQQRGENYQGPTDIEQIFAEINPDTIFDDRLWEFSFAQSFIHRLKSLNDNDAIEVLVLMKLILQGYINPLQHNKFALVKQSQVGSVKFPFQYDYECGFVNKLPKIAFQVFPKKYPQFDEAQAHPSSFIFVHEIIFISIFNDQKQQKSTEQTYEQDVAIFIKNQHNQPNFFKDLKIIKEIDYPKVRNQIGTNQILKVGSKTMNECLLVGPRQFVQINCKNTKYIFNQQLYRWVDEVEEQQYHKKKARIAELEDNQYIIKRYCQLPSSQQLLTILSKIPNFKVNLTSEQQQTITQKGDAIVIGRSGTGKTTCALLKLFSTDILFRLRVKLDQIKYSTSDLQLNENDNSIKLKTIFVTASPLLACQVKRLYDRLILSIQNSINSKRQRLRQNQTNIIQEKNETLQEDFEKSTFQILDAMQDTEEQQNNEKQDDDIDDDEINEFEKEMGSFTKFTEVPKYPIFLTLRKLISLIDASLLNPYFKNYELQNKTSQWHGEQYGQMKLDSQKFDTILNEQAIQQKINIMDQKDFIFVNMQEVTLEVFERVFWPQIIKIMATRQKDVKCLDPTLVWAEICTKIKGHETSHEYPDKYMNYENYYYYHRVLSEIHTQLLFESFEVYEQLKTEFCYYDLLDVVNHINNELTQGNDVIETVHFLILDELQDVPRAVLILLQKLTEFGLFCCGDNAQNIAKGIGYKFHEVQNCLLNQRSKQKQNKYKDVKLFDLNVNFRSHNQILQLANSVIKILEIFFPYKIDKLKKETSDLIGPKPIIIQSEDPQDLLNYIQEFFSNETQVVEFGCNQAIIVKDQESKTKVPIELQNALVLTIYEAKGLEFDDVILYNFFNDCPSTIEDWRILFDLEVRKQYVREKEFLNFQTVHSSEIIGSQLNTQQQLIEINQIYLTGVAQKAGKKQPSIDNFVEYSNLCQDLKQLYVAITRPKKKLIIFDQNFKKRNSIQNIWWDLNAIDVIIKKQIRIPDTQFIIIQQQDSKSNWKKQGYRMFRLNNYDQAAKCFNFAEDVLMEKKSRAYFLASKTSIMNQNFTHYLEAAKLFEEIDLPLRAAQCYFSAKDYRNAYINYLKTKQRNEIAESAYFAGYYEIAGEIFIELKEIRRAIECYHKLNDWDKVIKILNDYKDDFSSEERIAFLNNFFPKFLSKMTEEIEIQDKQLQEQQEEQQEKNDLEESESFCVQNSIIEEPIKQEINAQNENAEQQQNIIELDQSQSFQVENSEQSFDHLSFYDPDDEWLQNDKKSLIKSIASSSVQSQLSNVLLLNQSSNVSLLKSRTNIFIKNNVLQQLVQKFMLFSEEFQQHLESRKNKQLMLSNRNEEEREFDHMINFLYDLDNIDIETIYLLLDQLEQFKSYKLCIYVCNQFKLANHLGRYLISLASQYTPLTRNKVTLDQASTQNNLKRKGLLDQAAVAQIALNNILESINPQFIQFKYEEQLHSLNSLGLNCYKELIGLGFWRSVIYQLDFQNALDLCGSFGQYEEILNILDQVKSKRKDNNLSNYEQFLYSKYKYFQQVSNSLKGIRENFESEFNYTSEYFSKNKQINQNQFANLIKNANLSLDKPLTYKQQLNQVESCVLTHLYLLNYQYDQQQLQKEDLLKFVDIQLELHNKLAQFIPSENISDVIQFLYKFSLPKGQIMNHYSQYTLVHITSQLCNYTTKTTNEKKKQQQQQQQQQQQNPVNNNTSNRFIDIGYEFMLAPFQSTLVGIYHLFSRLLGKLYENYSRNQFDYFENIIQNGFYIKSQEKIQKDLLNFITLSIIEQKQKLILSNLLAKSYSSMKFHLAQESMLKNNPEQEKNSILSSITVISSKEFYRILATSNIRIKQIQPKIRKQLIDESCNLFYKIKQQSSHAQMILALNMLHCCGNIPLAIFTLKSLKNINREGYLKYLEFLECQEYNIVEDQFGCFMEFYTDFENKLYSDELIYHLIRIGMLLLISSVNNKQQELQIPKLFALYIKDCKELENQKLNLKLFNLENQEIFVEYIECLGKFLETCESDQYVYLANILLVVIFINVIDITVLANSIKKIVDFNHKCKFYQIIASNLNKNRQVRQEKFITNNELYIAKYSSEKLMKITINKVAKESELEIIYNNCLQTWSNYQQEADIIKQNGKKLLNLWRQKRQKYQILQNYKLAQFQYTLRMSYFQNYRKQQVLYLHQNGLKQYEESLEKGFVLQENLLQYYNQPLDSIDLHFCSSQLENLAILLEKQINAQEFKKRLSVLDKEFKTWIENNASSKATEQSLLERNKEILAIKWKNLKSGVKVLRKQNEKAKEKKVEISTIQEEDEEV